MRKVINVVKCLHIKLCLLEEKGGRKDEEKRREDRKEGEKKEKVRKGRGRKRIEESKER